MRGSAAKTLRKLTLQAVVGRLAEDPEAGTKTPWQIAHTLRVMEKRAKRLWRSTSKPKSLDAPAESARLLRRLISSKLPLRQPAPTPRQPDLPVAGPSGR